jgi:hypothetical protein
MYVHADCIHVTSGGGKRAGTVNLKVSSRHCLPNAMTMDVSSQAPIELSHFCKFCLFFLQKLPEAAHQMSQTWEVERAEDQSFEAFRESAFQGCFICSKVWNLSERHRVAWVNFQRELWTPMYTLPSKRIFLSDSMSCIMTQYIGLLVTSDFV